MREKILDCLDVLNRMTVTGRANCWAVAAVSGTLEEILNDLEAEHQKGEGEHQEDEGEHQEDEGEHQEDEGDG